MNHANARTQVCCALVLFFVGCLAPSVCKSNAAKRAAQALKNLCDKQKGVSPFKRTSLGLPRTPYITVYLVIFLPNIP